MIRFFLKSTSLEKSVPVPPPEIENSVILRKLEERDLEAVSELNPWELRKKRPDYGLWLHQSPPYSGVAWIAAAGSDIVGYFGTAAVKLKIEDKFTTCYRGELFVHPRYRGSKNNIYKRLMQEAMGEVATRQHLIYGVPIMRLINFYKKKFGGSTLKSIPTYLHTMGLRGFFRKFFGKSSRRDSFSKNLKIKKISSFDGRFDILWQKASALHSIMMVRDSSYLNWRYLKEPGAEYAIFEAERAGLLRGYIILTVKNGEGLIFDLFDLQEHEVTQALLRHAVHYFEISGVKRIRMNCSNDYYESQLREAGFVKNKKPAGSGEIFMIRSYCADIKEEVLFDPGKWFINTADIMMA